MPAYDRFWLDDGQRRAPIAPDRSTAGGRPRSILGAFLQTCGARRFDGVKARFSSPREARDRKIDHRVARSVVRKMSIGWNYVGKLTPMRSNISIFERHNR